MSSHIINIPDIAPSRSSNAKVEFPNKCPWCHVPVSPKLENTTKSNGGIVRGSSKQNFSIIFSCPNCHEHFLQRYLLNLTYKTSTLTSIDSIIKLDDIPQPETDFKYPSEIDNISKEFKNIISQAAHAEGLGFNHISGIGYRKALEFLVKDYLINHKKLNEDKISKKSLGKCIDQDIEDDRLKRLATAATWIGNDETHYVRKHMDKNIADMKKFLDAMIYFISLELSIEDAEDFTS